MQTSIFFFLAQRDEDYLSFLLKQVVPTLKFVDGNHWSANTPPLKDSIAHCESNDIFLWDTGIYPSLPAFKGRKTPFAGPQTGWVIPMERCLEMDDALFCGSISYASSGIENTNSMDNLAGIVKKLFSKHFTTDLVMISGFNPKVIDSEVSTRRFVGPSIAKWLDEDPVRVLRDRSVENYFVNRSTAYFRGYDDL